MMKNAIDDEERREAPHIVCEARRVCGGEYVCLLRISRSIWEDDTTCYIKSFPKLRSYPNGS